MDRITRADVVKAVEVLIDAWGRDLSDDDFLEALEEMEDRARTAIEARREDV